jgi:3-methyladenine DNA glycosylase/8-oxoguanine DNA glycosylase
MRFDGQVFGIRLDNQGSIDVPAVRLVIFTSQPIMEELVDRLAAEISCRYDLSADLGAFYDGFHSDPQLAPVLARWRGVRPSSYTSLYEYLVIATVLQNANVRRTVQMMENLFRQFGSRAAFDGRELSAFWDPGAIQRVDETVLRELKLGYRAKTIKRQAEAFGPGGLEEQTLRGLPTADLKHMLLGIYGIGPASVGYLLFGQFKRYEVFDYLPPWEQKIYSRLLFNQELVDSKILLEEIERRWGAWKMLAAHLLFEDLFWRRKNAPVPWLEELIRL